MTDPGARILLVEDDSSLRTMLLTTLVASGYLVTGSSDGMQALDELSRNETHQYDLVITDVKMPNMDGITLLKKIRRYYKDLPVLFISGETSQKIATLAHPDGYLAKPFHISNLEMLIEKTLSARLASYRPGHQPRVLIDAGETDLGEMLNDALTDSRYLPFAVSDQKEALRALECGRFDVMITQVEKPGSEKTENVRMLRKKYPSLPTVLVSTSLTPDEIDRIYDPLKFAGLLLRPFRTSQLIASLDQATDAVAL